MFMYEKRKLGQVELELLSPLKGQIAFSDFLSPAGTIEFIAYAGLLDNKSLRIFRISFPGYSLEASIDKGYVIILRNEYFQRSEQFLGHESCHVAIQWDTDSIGCGINPSNSFSDAMNQKLRSVQTPFTLPPIDIIRMLRENNLLFNCAYRTSDDFFVTLLDCIHLTEMDIRRHGCERFLWGKGGDKKRPLDEPEISKFVAGYLLSHGAARNFDVTCEPVTGSGNIDFYVVAPLVNSGLARIAIEAKKAENVSFVQGFEHQLPSYMRTISATHGIFLTYWLKSQDYPFPKQNSYNELEIEKLDPIIRLPTVRTVSLNLSNGPTPSHLSE